MWGKGRETKTDYLVSSAFEAKKSKQKMHCGLRRSNRNRPKGSDRGKCFLSRKSLEQNLKASTEDCEEAFVIWLRCPMVIFSHRHLTLPFLCPDNSNYLGSGAQAKMDDFTVVSPPVDSFRAHQHKERTGDFDAVNPSETSIDSSKGQKNAKKNARRKARKKAKRKNKLSSDTGSTELEVLSEECALGSSTFETSINNDMDHGDGPVSYESTLVNSLPDCLVSVNDSEGDSNGITYCSETSETCTSCTDDMDVSEDTITSVVHNFTGEHPAFNSEDGSQAKDMGFSISKGLEDKHGETIHCCDDMSSKGFSDMPDSLVLGSVSVGCSSEDSPNAGYDDSTDAGYNVGPSNEQGSGISDSEAHQSTRNECFSRQSPSNGVVDSCNNADRMKLHSAGCSSSDIQLDARGKRDKQAKMVVENGHGCVGKENVGCFQLDKTLKEAPLFKRNCNNANIASKSEDKNRSRVKVHRKSKKNSSPGSKQEYNCHSRKRSLAMKASSNAPARINIQENEMSVFPVLWNGQKGSGSISQSYSQNDCPEPELQTQRVESITSELVHSLQDCTGNLEPPERCSTISNMKDHITEGQNNSLLESLDSLNMSSLHEGQSAVHLHPLIGEEVAEVDKEVYLSENSKQEHSSASVMKKWKPVAKKNSGFASLGRSDISLLAHADEPAAEGWTPKNSVEEKASSNSHKPISSNDSEIMCVDHSFGNANCSSPEDKSPIQNTCTPKQLSNKHPAVNCFTHSCKEKHIYAFGADSSKISGALHDAYRVQQLSESVQLATGCPIADFERLLHAASPIICRSNSVKICQTCVRDEVGRPLCRHEAPNITLRSLWKWYEKHGSYGLEVRLEDCEYSKRLGFYHSAFRAYFVPSLSAVQLFKKPRSHHMDNGPVVSRACEMSKTSQSSFNIGQLPIFSILFPRPCTEETSFSPLENQMHSSQVSSMSQSVDTTITDDSELLFEYFESDQPQLRKPLFEKIKELVSGDGPSWNKVYGDPTKLDSMNLDELHHSSWYSVAWYPIYRIPDGEFRAAFLTYHSFGHLVHRSSTFDSHRKDACIVSPVVGLQSYNAQRERWFHLKQPILSQTEETTNLKPSEILRKRLKTLEQTASLMARAEVSKGNLKSVNRHPDYEFFLSRQRW